MDGITEGPEEVTTLDGIIVGETEGPNVGTRNVPVGVVVGISDGLKVHVCALGELKKILVGEVMAFPIQKTHFREVVNAKENNPNYYYYFNYYIISFKKIRQQNNNNIIMNNKNNSS